MAYYPVERIVTSRTKVDIILVKTLIINPYQGAQKEFLVLWKGWPIQDASWVAQKDLTPYLLKYGFRTSFYVVRESFL